MARNGSGVMSVPYPDFVAGTAISSGQMDANNADIVAEISNSIAADGQTTVTANIPMASHKFTGLSAGSAATDSAHLGQVQAQAYVWCGTAGGTADAITLSPSPAITALAAGMVFRWKSGSSANTGAMTIAVSGLVAVAAQNDGSALAAGDHAANKWYDGVYDGAAFQIRRIRLGGSGDLLAANNLSDLASAATARTNLGLGSLATKSTAALTDISGVATSRLLGRTTAGSGSPEEISVGSGLTLSGGTLSSSGNAPIASATASGAASLYVDWTNNSYAAVEIVFVASPDTDNTEIRGRVRQSATDKSGSSDYIDISVGATPQGYLTMSSATAVGSSGTESGVTGFILINTPASAKDKVVNVFGTYVRASDGSTRTNNGTSGGRFIGNTSEITGVTLYAASGNVTGSMYVYAKPSS